MTMTDPPLNTDRSSRRKQPPANSATGVVPMISLAENDPNITASAVSRSAGGVTTTAQTVHSTIAYNNHSNNNDDTSSLSPKSAGAAQVRNFNSSSSNDNSGRKSSRRPLFGKLSAVSLGQQQQHGKKPSAVSSSQHQQQPLFGSKPSKKNSLEDDIPDELQTQHSQLLPPGVGVGVMATAAANVVSMNNNNKGGGLLDDDSDGNDDDGNNNNNLKEYRQVHSYSVAAPLQGGAAAAASPPPFAASGGAGSAVVRPLSGSAQHAATQIAAGGGGGGAVVGTMGAGGKVSNSRNSASLTAAPGEVYEDSVQLQHDTGNSNDGIHPPATQNSIMSEEDQMNAAIAESKRQNNAGTVELLSSDEIEDAKENRRTLWNLCHNGTNAVDRALLQGVLDMCVQDKERITNSIQRATDEEQLSELIALNYNILDAIEEGERALKDFIEKEDGNKKPAASSSPKQKSDSRREPATGSTTAAAENDGLDVRVLVENRDIFSLICMMRAQQNERRLDAALALMKFARDAELSSTPEREDACKLRDEILSSGGMLMLLTVFRAQGTMYELKVVAALAVAYNLSCFVDSGAFLQPSLGIKIMECLQFLSTCRSVSPAGEVISTKDTFKASTLGLATFWINQLEPMLNSDRRQLPEQNGSGRYNSSFRALPSTSRNRNRIAAGDGAFDQRQEKNELSELLEMTVSLIIHIAKQSDDREQASLSSQDGDFSRYILVEQVCAVEVARPIAVREGILSILVKWIRSKDHEKIRPAASALRYLTSIQNRYMAGWIHSQMVHDGALQGIIDLTLNVPVKNDVLLAIAQILSSLCPAALVDPNCVSCLIVLLDTHSWSEVSEEVAIFAGSALLQLAAGAITRVSVFNSKKDVELLDFVAPDKRDTLIDEIVDQSGISTFVAICLKHRGKLRSVAVETLRVLSEDTSPIRQTRLQLCDDDAAKALGITLKDSLRVVVEGFLSEKKRCNNEEKEDNSGRGDKSISSTSQQQQEEEDPLKEFHNALCALANILDPVLQEGSLLAPPQFEHQRQRSTYFRKESTLLIDASVQTAESGGLESLLKIASIPIADSSSATPQPSVQGLGASEIHSSLPTYSRRCRRMDLLGEACRSLALISPLLLSDDVVKRGYAVWADKVLTALHHVLMQMVGAKDLDSLLGCHESAVELYVNVLSGLSALAKSEPLKVRIVEKGLALLLQVESARDGSADISNAASQTLQTLEFAEDGFDFQVAGTNPNLLADWFCLRRSLLIQAMARAEIKQNVLSTWNVPFHQTKSNTGMTTLFRDISSASVSKSSEDGSANCGKELFVNFCNDKGTARKLETIIRQYGNIYESQHQVSSFYKESVASFQSEQEGSLALDDNNSGSKGEEVNDGLFSQQIYPLSSSSMLSDWILKHRRLMCVDTANIEERSTTKLQSQQLSDHVVKLMDCCFPSRLLRDEVLPTNNFRPDASFNFRALMMPQRRYFSFRREGQLLSRLCDKEASTLDGTEVHWTLGFTNSSFAGEFAESFVQVLYMCPMIHGLSFCKNAVGSDIVKADGGNTPEKGGSDDEGALLANLVGSLPPWISHLTFEGLFDDQDLCTLVATLETISKLSAVPKLNTAVSLAQTDPALIQTSRRGRRSSKAQIQGKFRFLSIRRSPRIAKETWKSFFNLFSGGGTNDSLRRGFTQKNSRSMQTPLSSLQSLDLSDNALGDELCAFLLDLVHKKDACCSLERLDLSGNNIAEGSNVSKVLLDYVKTHRHGSQGTAESNVGNWKSSLHTLSISNNSLHKGEAWLNIIDLLKNNALELKYLDLSSNGLKLSESNYYTDVLVSSLQANTCLCTLDLSNNNFSLADIDHLLRQMLTYKNDSNLAFLLLDGNSPPLTERQRSSLQSFSETSREVVLRNSYGQKVTKSMPRLPSYSDIADLSTTVTQPGDNMITVLFSAPLVYADNNKNLCPFAKLDFDMERELIWQCLKEASRDIELAFDNATHDRLIATMTRRCSCLHYSGHGHQQFLPFEDGSGGVNWFEVNKIKQLIANEGGVPFRFVFVSACYSGLAGETFASAGVPHVVCCQQESELKDIAALAFTRQFYLALAVGHTVKESFEQGCKAVRATPNLRNAEREMQKFMLLPPDGNHDVPIFNAKPVVEWPSMATSVRGSNKITNRRSARNLFTGSGARSSELSVFNMMQEDPSPTAPQFFLGREVDTYRVLKSILDKRLVNVVGEPGVGRSSLVCSLCHYINERKSTIIGIEKIYFVKVKQGRRRKDRFRILVDRFTSKLVEAEKADPPMPGTDIETKLDTICKSLKNEKALVVFDRVHLLEDPDDANEFTMLLSNLFRETRNVKVLLTSRHPLGIPSLGGTVEYSYDLGPLTFANTVRLFAHLCPYLHTPSERKKLFERLATDSAEAELLPTDPGLSEFTKTLFAILGDGIPSRIEKAAYNVTKENYLAMLSGSFREE